MENILTFPFVFSQSASKEIPFCEQPNVFFPDREKFEEKYDLSYLSKPVFDSEKIYHKVVDLAALAKEKNQIPTERIWMGIYFDREIRGAHHPKVSVRYINEELGFGVFAEQRMPPCSYVGEYTGVVLDWKKKILKEKFYAIRYNIWDLAKKKFFLDGEKMGNFTRCINHSSNPNLGLQSVYWQGIPRLIFIALREIKEGMQLTFDYGDLYWKDMKIEPKNLS